MAFRDTLIIIKECFLNIVVAVFGVIALLVFLGHAIILELFIITEIVKNGKDNAIH